MTLWRLFSLSFSFLVLVNLDWAEASFKERDKILYKDLGTLNFYPGEWTRARRTRSVPQLVCLKGCHHPQPKAVECTNTGWDGTSNLWKCKSQLDSSYSLDSVEVVCEGYSSPDDAFVTVGSCSLEYSVKQRNSSGNWTNGGGIGSLYFLAFCGFLIFVLYKTCLRTDEENIRQNSSTNNDGPDDGHGPQMGWNIPGMNQRRRPGNSPGYGFMPGTDTCGNQDNAARGGGGGGGFWTGLATGGVLGYLFSGNNNRNSGYGYNHPQSSSYFGGGSSGGLFGSGGSDSSYYGRGSRGSGGLFGSSTSEDSENVSTARYRQR